MEHEHRPALHALVSFYVEPYGCLMRPRMMPLEDAVDYARFGFAVLVDPQDERDLAMWERLERATAPRKHWYER